MIRLLIRIISLTRIIHVPVIFAANGQKNDSVMLNSTQYSLKFYQFTDRSLNSTSEMVLVRLFNISHTLVKK
ncbi:MAG: hypothetical protein AMS27_14415 [Bacteroides sp. SM23_62_1]|nr:MAG: hypothetical protein AMS27_14415 [Bacteroides sp. SM23_62_1]